ncbi:hypothetical protein M758_1G105500 [Ceratodon purpureus]|nr:hypothetical protein M758_1G105500 [Ceratodon purpureus]
MVAMAMALSLSRGTMALLHPSWAPASPSTPPLPLPLPLPLGLPTPLALIITPLSFRHGRGAKPKSSCPRPNPKTSASKSPSVKQPNEAKCTIANETSPDPFSVLALMLVAGACAAAFGCSSPQLGAAYAAEGVTEDSTTIFQRSCAGCHAGGGNILQPNATLFAKDLDRNGRANVDDVFQITYFGKGRMPGYGQKCTPRGQCTFGPRLSDSDIRALAEFVRLQADQGWTE